MSDNVVQDGAPGTQAIPDRIWEEVAPRIKAAIGREYETLPAKWGGAGDQVDWMRASLRYIGTLDRGLDERTPQVREPGWWARNITGFMAVVALLAIIFAVILVLNKEASNGLIDITKLLIGALIGSAAGAAGVAATTGGPATGTRRGG